MAKCLYCGTEVARKSNNGPIPKYCCPNHYYKYHYQVNREHYREIQRAYYLAHYKSNPLALKYHTDEERREAQRKRSKDFYYKNKDYCRQKNTEWYRKHRDDPDLKRRHALAMKKYHAKKKLLKESECEKKWME